MNESCAGINTDKEIWREIPGDYYSPSIHVTWNGGIGINVGGHVIVAPIEEWHRAGTVLFCIHDNSKKRRMHKRFLRWIKKNY